MIMAPPFAYWIVKPSITESSLPKRMFVTLLVPLGPLRPSRMESRFSQSRWSRAVSVPANPP